MPRSRIIAYVVFAAVVVSVGLWGMLVSGSAREGDGEVVALPPRPSGATTVDGGGTVPTDHPEIGSPATGSTEALIFVQVAGAVRSPGVYRLPEGCRVFEALKRAGGALPDGDPDRLPLAGVLSDGARVEVPRKGEEGSVGSAALQSPFTGNGSLASGSAQQPVSLNRATAEELQTLPGVGPKTAERIIAYREGSGPFQTVDDLELVSGIGPATMEELRDAVVP